MSGFFGAISKSNCVKDVFYGTDYHSNPGKKRAGMVFIFPGKGIVPIPGPVHTTLRNFMKYIKKRKL
jgi:hypothetical protein